MGMGGPTDGPHPEQVHANLSASNSRTRLISSSGGTHITGSEPSTAGVPPPAPISRPDPEDGPRDFTWSASSTDYWTNVLQQEQRAQRAREHRRLKIRYYITNAVLVSLTAAHFTTYIAGLHLSQWIVAPLDENPLIGVSAEGIVRAGGIASHKIYDDQQWWRLISAMFVDSGAIHCYANLNIIWAAGGLLGHKLGPYALLSIFVLSGLAAAVTSANIGSEYVSATGSGPPFGLMGATCALLILRRHDYANHVISWCILAGLLMLNCFLGAMPLVDNSGNTAALISGFMIGCAACLLHKKQSKSGGSEALVWVGSVLLPAIVVAGLVLGIIGIALKAPAGGCCDTWVCTPSHLWSCDSAKTGPHRCSWEHFTNGSAWLTCPKGDSHNLVGIANATTPQTELLSLCNRYCSSMTILDGAGAPPAAGSPGVPGRNIFSRHHLY